MRQAVLSTTVVIATVLVCALSPTPAGATTIFISDTTSPVHLDTYTVDISAGGSGSLGIWVIPDNSQTLNLIDLNLRIDESDGNAIDFVTLGVNVFNPLISGAGGARRWFDSNVTIGVDSVSANLVTGMTAAMTTGIGGSGDGTGLSDANGANDPLYEDVPNVPGGAYLFATVDYTVVNASKEALLYLQISDDGIEDNGGLVESVVFGLWDLDLNASDPDDRDVDSTTEDAVTNSVTVDLLGDMTGNGTLDLDDVPAFILALVNPSGYSIAFPGLDPVERGDINDDLRLDLGDIDGFSGLFGGAALARAEATPEPSTIVLAGIIGLLVLVGNGRRRRS